MYLQHYKTMILCLVIIQFLDFVEPIQRDYQFLNITRNDNTK